MFFPGMKVAAILTKVDLLNQEINTDIRQADKSRAVQQVIYINKVTHVDSFSFGFLGVQTFLN